MITLKRQGAGYSVHLHGNRLARFLVLDRRATKQRRRGWLLRLYGNDRSERTREEIFPTLKLLCQWVEHSFFGGDVVGAHRMPASVQIEIGSGGDVGVGGIT